MDLPTFGGIWFERKNVILPFTHGQKKTTGNSDPELDVRKCYPLSADAEAISKGTPITRRAIRYGPWRVGHMTKNDSDSFVFTRLVTVVCVFPLPGFLLT